MARPRYLQLMAPRDTARPGPGERALVPPNLLFRPTAATELAELDRRAMPPRMGAQAAGTMPSPARAVTSATPPRAPVHAAPSVPLAGPAPVPPTTAHATASPAGTPGPAPRTPPADQRTGAGPALAASRKRTLAATQAAPASRVPPVDGQERLSRPAPGHEAAARAATLSAPPTPRDNLPRENLPDTPSAAAPSPSEARAAPPARPRGGEDLPVSVARLERPAASVDAAAAMLRPPPPATRDTAPSPPPARKAVHIGTLEVRVVPPAPPAAVPAPRPAARPTARRGGAIAPISRGFGVFGLGQG